MNPHLGLPQVRGIEALPHANSFQFGLDVVFFVGQISNEVVLDALPREGSL